MVRSVYLPLHPLWVTCKIWVRMAGTPRCRASSCMTKIVHRVRSHRRRPGQKAPLTPIPLGEREAAGARVGDTVVMLHRFPLFTQLESTSMHLTAVWHQELTGSNRAKTVTALRTDSRLDASSLGAPLIATSGKVIGWVGPIPFLRYNDMTGDHSSSVANSAVAVPLSPVIIESASQGLGGRKTWLGIEGVTVNGPPATQGPSACRSHAASSSRSWTMRGPPRGRGEAAPASRWSTCPTSENGSSSPAATSSSPSTAKPCTRKACQEVLDEHAPGDIVRVEDLQRQRAADRQSQTRCVPIHAGNELGSLASGCTIRRGSD